MILYLLVAASAFYRMQSYSAFPFSAGFRIALFGLVVMAVVAQRKLFAIALPFWALGASVMWTGVHTYIRSDFNLAVLASLRFSNVMILAPVASVLLLDRRDLAVVFYIYVAVYLIALGTLIHQLFFGGGIFVPQNYIAIRGDLVRYATIVGEPNVGGMLAVIAFSYGAVMPGRRWLAILLGGSAVAFVFLSISKAAMLGMVVAVVAGLIVLSKDQLVRAFTNVAMAGISGVLLLQLLGSGAYFWVTIESVLGGIRGEPSALVDLASRQHVPQSTTNGEVTALFNFVLGGSFVNVGSAAQEIRGPMAGVVLPHNSYMELFLAGGGLLLGCVLFLMARAFANLWSSAKVSGENVDRCALLCLALLSCWMIVYPIIYEPVTGCLFWIIVGYGNRRLVRPPCRATLPN